MSDTSQATEDLTTDESAYIQANPQDVLRDLEQVDSKRQVIWDNLFEKYSNKYKTKGIIDVQDMSVYVNKYMNTSVNYGQSKKKIKTKKCETNGTQVTQDTFLFSYVTSEEIRQILLDYKCNKISLAKLINVVENTFKSNLKQLLISREEARYLEHKCFSKYQQAAECEAQRLRQFLGKKNVALYICIHDYSKPIDEIIKLIEDEYSSTIGDYLPNSMVNYNLNPARKAVLHKKFVLEWHRLRQFLPAEYLVEYCDWLETEKV